MKKMRTLIKILSIVLGLGSLQSWAWAELSQVEEKDKQSKRKENKKIREADGTEAQTQFDEGLVPKSNYKLPNGKSLEIDPD